MLESSGLNIPVENKVCFEDLSKIKDFFYSDGIFVSNDSGMAHLAALCGLSTITIFIDSDPLVWHPRGDNHSIKKDAKTICVNHIESKVIEMLSTFKESA